MLKGSFIGTIRIVAIVNSNATAAATAAAATYALERVHLSTEEHPEVLTSGCD